MYDDHAQRGIVAEDGGAGEAEMFSYQLLLRIDSHGGVLQHSFDPRLERRLLSFEWSPS